MPGAAGLEQAERLVHPAEAAVRPGSRASEVREAAGAGHADEGGGRGDGVHRRQRRGRGRGHPGCRELPQVQVDLAGRQGTGAVVAEVPARAEDRCVGPVQRGAGGQQVEGAVQVRAGAGRAEAGHGHGTRHDRRQARAATVQRRGRERAGAQVRDGGRGGGEQVGRVHGGGRRGDGVQRAGAEGGRHAAGLVQGEGLGLEVRGVHAGGAADGEGVGQVHGGRGRRPREPADPVQAAGCGADAESGLHVQSARGDDGAAGPAADRVQFADRGVEQRVQLADGVRGEREAVREVVVQAEVGRPGVGEAGAGRFQVRDLQSARTGPVTDPDLRQVGAGEVHQGVDRVHRGRHGDGGRGPPGGAEQRCAVPEVAEDPALPEADPQGAAQPVPADLGRVDGQHQPQPLGAAELGAREVPGGGAEPAEVGRQAPDQGGQSLDAVDDGDAARPEGDAGEVRQPGDPVQHPEAARPHPATGHPGEVGEARQEGEGVRAAAGEDAAEEAADRLGDALDPGPGELGPGADEFEQRQALGGGGDHAEAGQEEVQRAGLALGEVDRGLHEDGQVDADGEQRDRPAEDQRGQDQRDRQPLERLPEQVAVGDRLLDPPGGAAEGRAGGAAGLVLGGAGLAGGARQLGAPGVVLGQAPALGERVVGAPLLVADHPGVGGQGPCRVLEAVGHRLDEAPQRPADLVPEGVRRLPGERALAGLVEHGGERVVDLPGGAAEVRQRALHLVDPVRVARCGVGGQADGVPVGRTLGHRRLLLVRGHGRPQRRAAALGRTTCRGPARFTTVHGSRSRRTAPAVR